MIEKLKVKAIYDDFTKNVSLKDSDGNRSKPKNHWIRDQKDKEAIQRLLQPATNEGTNANKLVAFILPSS